MDVRNGPCCQSVGGCVTVVLLPSWCCRAGGAAVRGIRREFSWVVAVFVVGV